MENESATLPESNVDLHTPAAGEETIREDDASAEARSSYRYPAQQGSDRGRLFVEERSYPLLLLDESAGGFNIAVRSNVQVLMGQTVTVHLPSGWFECEVRRSQTEGEENHVGLKRVRAVVPPEEEHQNKSGPWLTYGNVMQFGAVALGVTILAVLLMQPGIMGNWFKDMKPTDFSRTQISTEYSALMPDPQTTRVLEGFNSLTDTHMTKALRLNTEQVKNLDGIYADASRQLGGLYEKIGTKAPGLWQRESALIVQRTAQRVLCVLSDDQIRAWQHMLKSVD